MQESDAFHNTGRAGGDRTHDPGIMRWMQTVGLVRWCPNDPKSEEILSGGVRMVCGMKRGILQSQSCSTRVRVGGPTREIR
jgi:hypothetical protein